jgi:hypothetical protein
MTLLLLVPCVGAWAVPLVGWAGVVDLTWTDNSVTEDGFKVERRHGATGTFYERASTAANVTTWTDTTAEGGSTWCYRVLAARGAERSGPSNEVCVDMPVPLPPLQAPGDLNIKVTVDVTSGTKGEAKE